MKLSTFLFVFLVLCGMPCVFSQPSILWQKNLGGANHEYTSKTIPTSDGGLAFVGFSSSNNGDVSGNNGGIDLWVGKLNSSGDILWSFLYGGSDDDKGSDILQTVDGGYMVAGRAGSNDGDVTGHHGTYNTDFWVLKLDATGTLIWSNCYGGNYDDNAAAIAETTDGNYYISGTTNSTGGDVSGNHGLDDLWVIKINSSGTLLSQKCIGGTNYEEGISMTITTDDGCIVCGRSNSTDGDALGFHGGFDMLVAKLDATLSIEWSKCYGGTQTEECNSIVVLNDGSYAALGYTTTHNDGDVTGHHGAQGIDDFWLIKLSTVGVITSAKCYGGSDVDQANGLTKTNDGGFVMCGLTNSTDGDVSGFHTSFFDPDVWLIKVNSIGNFVWQRCCGGSGQDEGFDVFELNSNTFIVTAFSYSNDYDVPNNNGSADGWIFKLSETSSVGKVLENNNISIYPNPTNTFICIKTLNELTIEIIDSHGQIVKTEYLTYSNNVINISDLNAGNYIARWYDQDVLITKKFIVQE